MPKHNSRVRSKSKFVPDRNYTIRVGGAYLWGLPIFVSVTTALYLHSLNSSLILIILQVMLLLLILLSITSGPHLLPSVEAVWLAIKSVPLSLGLLRTLGPALFITIVLSVFSQDVWRIIGQLSVSKLLTVSGLLVAPAIALGITSLRSQISRLVGLPLSSEQMIQTVRQIREVASSQEQGLLSPEGWGTANRELAWRHDAHLLEFARGKLGIRPIVGFSLVFLIAGLFIGIVLWIYLVVILRAIVTTDTLADWLHQPVATLDQPVPVLPLIAMGRGLIATIKVAFFLASLQVMVYGVSVLTDDAYKAQFADVMQRHIREWVTAIAVYHALLTPGFQVWAIDERDRKKSIVRYIIVLPSSTTDAQAKQACEQICTREANTNLVVITAYERQTDPSEYHSGSNANRWRRIVNRRKSIDDFNHLDLSGIANELRYQHNLGMECLRQDKSLPDEWFGDQSMAIQIGKAIWLGDNEHDTIWHPYASLGKDGRSTFVEIALTKRLRSSADYQNLVKSALSAITKHTPDAKLIDISVYYRDRLEELANLILNREADNADYKDERSKRRPTSPSKWL